MNTKIGLLALALLFGVVKGNAQDKTEAETNSELLGLPGDNLDLYAALDLFQESKTIEEFEASLNDEKTGINNLDLNLDGDVDFIKVVTQKEGDDFAFVLQVDVQKEDVQDVAVIFVAKDKEEKVTVQMEGAEELYGKGYVIEPKLETPAVTANPAYSGTDTVVVKSEAATVVVIESQPIVHYVYSPVYSPYYSPYYYGYYPPYYHPYPIISVNVYYGRHHHHNNHYHGGHRGGNTVIVHNNNSYNNYNKTRNTSNTVNKNKSEGSYKRSNTAKSPPNNTKPSTGKPNSNPKNKSNVKENKSSVPSTKPTTKPAAKPAATRTTKPAATQKTKPAAKPAAKQAARPKGRKRR